jgi:hypothetical protein
LNVYEVGSVARVTTRFYFATVLVGAISSTATTLVVATASGFPPSGNYPIHIDAEDMLVTGGQGTTSWTVTRGTGIMSPIQHADGSLVTTPGDPTAVTFTAIREDGTTVSGTPVRDSTGVWHSDFIIDRSGRWGGRTVGTGALPTATRWEFFVNPQEVVP